MFDEDSERVDTLHELAEEPGEPCSEDEEVLEDLYPDRDVASLEAELALKRRETATAQREQAMYKGYLARQNSFNSASEEHAGEKTETEGAGRKMSTYRRRSKHPSKSGGHTTKAVATLTWVQKCDIAQREADVLNSDIKKEIFRGQGSVDGLRAVTEECNEVMENVTKFQRAILRDVVEASIKEAKEGQKADVQLRLFTRNYEQRTKVYDSAIDKLRLRISALRAQKRKTDAKIKEKEESGEVLHPVDFDQLKIENAQYVEKIEERNKKMLQLKRSAGRTVQTLNKYTEDLQVQQAMCDRRVAELENRKMITARIAREHKTALVEVAEARKVNQGLKKQLEEWKVPSTMDYVREKVEAEQLQAAVGTWSQRLRVAEATTARHRRMYREMGGY